MRDAVILLALVVAGAWALKRPWIGVLGWTLFSLMSPHVQFGYAAAGWPVAIGFAICTLIGLLITKDRQNPMAGAPVWWLLAFVAWICITLPFSIFFDQSYLLWERSIKIFLMVFVTLALITDKRKLEGFMWICVVSVAYYGVKGGIFTILTGGNHRVWGPGGFIEGNNEVALAVITIIPLMRYLQTQMTNQRAKMVMSGSMALCVVMALGTYSRGAIVGLGAMGIFFWMKNKNKTQWGLSILIILVLGLSLMPDQWWDRMNTIKSYESDASSMGRINAWRMAFNLAMDRFFGGGFMVWERSVFQIYAPVPEDVHAAHSIYFQIMAEHGFLGLFLWLGIGIATWMVARDLIKVGRANEQFVWAAQLGSMLQVSMIGYGAAGAFLSLAYYDLPYNVMVMAVVAKRHLQSEQLKYQIKQLKTTMFVNTFKSGE